MQAIWKFLIVGTLLGLLLFGLGVAANQLSTSISLLLVQAGVIIVVAVFAIVMYICLVYLRVRKKHRIPPTVS